MNTMQKYTTKRSPMGTGWSIFNNLKQEYVAPDELFYYSRNEAARAARDLNKPWCRRGGKNRLATKYGKPAAGFSAERCLAKMQTFKTE